MKDGHHSRCHFMEAQCLWAPQIWGYGLELTFSLTFGHVCLLVNFFFFGRSSLALRLPCSGRALPADDCHATVILFSMHNWIFGPYLETTKSIAFQIKPSRKKA
jgi:hypothetical protein